MPKNVGDLGKLIVSKGFEKLPKVEYIAKSGHTGYHSFNLFRFVTGLSDPSFRFSTTPNGHRAPDCRSISKDSSSQSLLSSTARLPRQP